MTPEEKEVYLHKARERSRRKWHGMTAQQKEEYYRARRERGRPKPRRVGTYPKKRSQGVRTAPVALRARPRVAPSYIRSLWSRSHDNSAIRSKYPTLRELNAAEWGE